MRSPFTEPVEVRDVTTGTVYWVVQDDDEGLGAVDKFPYRRDGVERLMCWCQKGQQVAEDRIDSDELGPGCVHEEAFMRWRQTLSAGGGGLEMARRFDAGVFCE